MENKLKTFDYGPYYVCFVAYTDSGDIVQERTGPWSLEDAQELKHADPEHIWIEDSMGVTVD